MSKAVKAMSPSSRCFVRDRFGNEIYLTQERWRHILAGHEELAANFGDLLETVRKGRRRQEPADPARYRYYRRCATLPRGFTHIVVAVVFKHIQQPDGTQSPNNFVTSAWGVFIYREA